MAHFYNSPKKPLPYKKIEGLEHIDKVIEIDQSPIGRTPRSNPATYTMVFDEIRQLFAARPEAQIRGYKPGRFSFNVSGGKCETCSGAGVKVIEMNFLPDVLVDCESCNGKRYNPETLEVRFKGRSIYDVLEMPIEEAVEFFSSIPKIHRILKTLLSVGMGYVKLGQPSTTLSGGEAQRIKLATELSKRSTGKTLYILDEPSTGLHFEDIRLLVDVLQRLVNEGNTVLVIEHNLDIVKVADFLIDLGPEGGKSGGQIIAQGTPEKFINAYTSVSHTAFYLEKEIHQTSQLLN
jgi:excinuclease ABC subunit A